MKKLLTTLIAIGFATSLMLSSGCVSSHIFEGSKEIKTEKELAKLNYERSLNGEPAIRATELSGGGVGLGFDLSALDVIMERPWMQLIAAIADGALIWGGYEAIDSINDDDDDDNSGGAGQNDNSAGGDIINVNGSNNTVNNEKSDNDEEAPIIN